MTCVADQESGQASVVPSESQDRVLSAAAAAVPTPRARRPHRPHTSIVRPYHTARTRFSEYQRFPTTETDDTRGCAAAQRDCLYEPCDYLSDYLMSLACLLFSFTVSRPFAKTAVYNGQY